MTLRRAFVSAVSAVVATTHAALLSCRAIPVDVPFTQGKAVPGLD